MQYWIFPDRVRFTLKKKVFQRLRRRHRIFWLEVGGSIESVGEIVDTDEGESVVEINLTPLQEPVRRFELEEILSESGLQRALEAEPDKPLDPEHAAELLALSKREPFTFIEQAGVVTGAVTGAIGKGVRASARQVWRPGRWLVEKAGDLQQRWTMPLFRRVGQWTAPLAGVLGRGVRTLSRFVPRTVRDRARERLQRWRDRRRRRPPSPGKSAPRAHRHYWLIRARVNQSVDKKTLASIQPNHGIFWLDKSGINQWGTIVAVDARSRRIEVVLKPLKWSLGKRTLERIIGNRIRGLPARLEPDQTTEVVRCVAPRHGWSDQPSWVLRGGQRERWEARKLGKRSFERIEPGDRVLWRERDGGVSSWGTVIAKRSRRSVIAYRRALLGQQEEGISAAEIRSLNLPRREKLLSAAKAAAMHEATASSPRSFEESLREELETIYALRERRGYPSRRDPEGAILHQAHRSQLSGLAFSGGGIRSATFNLGILQGLAEKRLLPSFDYLSTVSGGGYIGSWLVAWLRRFGMTRVAEKLAREHPEAKSDKPVAAEERWSPITFLREYSNYLTPELGLLSADTWTVFATYARNLLLNLLILVSALGALMLAPRLAVAVSIAVRADAPSVFHVGAFFLAVALLALGLGHLLRNVVDLSDFLDRPEPGETGDANRLEARQPMGPGAVQRWVVVPLCLAAWSGSCWIWRSHDLGSWEPVTRLLSASALDLPLLGSLLGRYVWLRWMTMSAVLYTGLWLLVSIPVWLGFARRSRRPQRRPWRVSRRIAWLAFGALLASSGALTADAFGRVIWPGTAFWFWLFVASLLYLAFWLLIVLIDWSLALVRQIRSRRREAAQRLWFTFLLNSTAFLAGLGGGVLLWWFGDLLHSQTSGGFAVMVLWGPPLLVVNLVVTAVLHIGLMGRPFPEEHRQWWSRLGAWMLIYSLGWIGLFSVAIYGPVAIDWLVEQGTLAASGVSLSWLLSTGVGIWAGRSANTGQTRSSRSFELLAQAAPYVFVLGLLALLAHVIQEILAAWLANPIPTQRGILPAHLAATWDETGAAILGPLAVAFVVLTAFSLLLSSRIDINEFSMHLFYRNRLIRAYLGASRARGTRRPHPFTGFDPRDDLRLDRLVPDFSTGTPVPRTPTDPDGTEPYVGPYPILNTALNLTAGDELAWQERKAASYFFAPLHYGFHTGREATDEDLDLQRQEGSELFALRSSRLANDGRGISLGTALTVSGAAVNPGMGYHSSRPLAFLMTVFNARLGLWQGNPKRTRAWRKPGPPLGLFYLLAELFGHTNENSKYVNLSDGGFFDNLGVYELVRRRCRFIVACDAEADPELEFAGLGNAIRKCRNDFGVDIEIDVEPIRKRGDEGLSDWHCAVGTIRYPEEHSPRGTFVYIKASLTGDEAEDLEEYAVNNPEFPHQSTADQWFDESQFESYRELGRHVAESVFGAADLEEAMERTSRRGRRIRLEPVFVDLRQAWHPPSKAVKESFTRHTKLLVQIFERLRNQPNLAFLVPQVYMELRDWRRGRPRLFGEPPKPRAWHPESPEELTSLQFQEAFFLCNSVIQLMENVYMDLELENEWRHPDNRGWKNLFRHWSWSWMFRLTWAVCASTYGARFQKFCERRLGLDAGLVWTLEPDAQGRRDHEHMDEQWLHDQGHLSDFEAELIRRVRSELKLPADSDTRVLALRILLLEPRAAFRHRQWQKEGHSVRPANESRRFEFTFGIAILRRETAREGGAKERWALHFLRVRDHLRSLGLGRRALEHLIRHRRVTWPAKPPRSEALRRVAEELDFRRLADMFKSVRNELGSRLRNSRRS